ncbi:hypothetical protein ABW19_dt0209461 [Dactylella cylindrospora]|nr:hypothetical protein ABW19_dt0209461 [Dactylella cylindrospora]
MISVLCIFRTIFNVAVRNRPWTMAVLANTSTHSSLLHSSVHQFPGFSHLKFLLNFESALPHAPPHPLSPVERQEALALIEQGLKYSPTYEDFYALFNTPNNEKLRDYIRRIWIEFVEWHLDKYYPNLDRNSNSRNEGVLTDLWGHYLFLWDKSVVTKGPSWVIEQEDDPAFKYILGPTAIGKEILDSPEVRRNFPRAGPTGLYKEGSITQSTDSSAPKHLFSSHGFAEAARKDYRPMDLFLDAMLGSYKAGEGANERLIRLKNTINIFASGLGWETLAEPLDPENDDPGNTLTELSEVQCNACFESFPKFRSIQLDCDHFHCHRCLKENVEIWADSSRAARCCKSIPEALIAVAVGRPMITAYSGILNRERSSRIARCHKCKTELLDPVIEDEGAYCLDCSDVTCVRCSERMHGGDCSEMSAAVALLQTARASDWSVCHKCHEMVEKSQGCNHMTCRYVNLYCFVSPRILSGFLY